MDTALQRRLRDLTESLVSDVMAAVRTATLDEVFANLPGSTSTTKARGGRDLPSRIERLLAAHPDGLGALQVRAELGVDQRAFARAITAMLAARSITKRGVRRGTRYTVAGAKASTLNATPVDRVASRWDLSERQVAVLRHLAQGKSNQEIATAVGGSVKAIELHVGAILKKARAKNRAALIARVWQSR